MAESALSAKFIPRPAREARSMVRRFLLIVASWRNLIRNLDADYQPERHYMRGLGPKWRERNSRSPV